jgi:hypothetical protein
MNPKVKDTIKRVGWTFLFAFGATLVTMAPGVLQAPNLKTGRALAVAAIVAAISAGASAVKNAVFPPGHPAR